MDINFNHPDNNDIPHPEKVFLGSGELNLACSLKKTIIVLVISAFVVAFLISRLFHYAPIWFKDDSRSAARLVPGSACGIIMLCSTILEFLRHGEKYKWLATGREFTITRKNKPSIILFYKEIVLVDYEPLKFLGYINQGYLVRVRTVRDEYEFKYAFPLKKASKRFEDTPFGLLARMVGDLRSMGLDEALRDNGIKDYDKPTIEEAFTKIVSAQSAREREKTENNNFFLK